ncbi:hypothetical protein C8A00DRAFT_30407 [Chaetomidium leptoderma]|uniref:Uncharacterized protein n=1 Tax=Chaetomidium leptoderma TaxID=669021 RepID=A0AAN7A1E4_9PEZI|nr:hypothetical protein C8A00DRAFT_30407 [Chaetomidium leptoderma]
MSSTTSSPTSPSPSAPLRTYATVSLHKSDTIRLLNFPPDTTSALEPVILACWPPGLDSQSKFHQSYEYKLKGTPFGYYRSQQHVGGIRLLRSVLVFLYERNWELVTSALCGRRYTAKDTLIFRQARAAESPLPPVEWLVLAPMSTDKLRVVYDADGVRLSGGDAERNHDHLGVLITAIKKTLEGLDYFDKGEWSHDSFEFELKGRPWRSRGEASVKMRILLMQLLDTIEGYGWRLYTTVLQRTSTDEDRILDTWYFVRERGDVTKVDVDVAVKGLES